MRQWATEIDAPIFSIDYSLAPECPYPRALEECFYGYCWALQNLEKLGANGSRIVLAGILIISKNFLKRSNPEPAPPNIKLDKLNLGDKYEQFIVSRGLITQKFDFFQPKKYNVHFPGDSAGANLVIGITMKCIENHIRIPDGIFVAYVPTILKFIATPARLLCLLDPLLPFGFLLGCVKGKYYFSQ